MWGWLNKKAQDSKVYMVGKELKWKFETYPLWRIAKTRLMGNLVIAGMLQSDPSFEAFFRNPFSYSREDAMRIYEGLERIRNQGHAELAATKSNLERFGVQMPQIAVDHAEDTARGLEVWMVTAGMSVNSGRADEALTIWKHLIASEAALPEAIRQLDLVRATVREFTGGDTESMFPGTDELRDVFSLVPDIVLQRLHNSFS